MNTHPNVQVLTQIYRDFSQGDYESMLARLPETVTFQIAGKSPFAGKFTKANFVKEYAGKLGLLTNHRHEFQVHDVLAGDLHGTVLATLKLNLHAKPIELRTVHVWRFENGVPIAGYEYSRDLYQFDAIWST